MLAKPLQIEYLPDMRVFITGATGFIGQHLCHELVQHDHEIIALVRNPHKASCLPARNITLLKGDLASFRNPDFQIPECDVVIHLAGTVTAKRQSEYDEINFLAVKELYSCILRQSLKPKRLLFASSLAATGPSTFDRHLDESHPPQPIDDYGRAKFNAEKFLETQTEIPVTIFRPCAVLGPLDANTFNLYKIAKTGFGFVPTGIPQKISFIGVLDLVGAIIRMMDESSTEHKTYFVSHHDPIDTHHLWRAVGQSLDKNIKLIKVPRPLLYLTMHTNTLYANLFDKPNVFDRKYYDQLKAPAWVCRSDRLTLDLGWKAEQSLSEVLKDAADSFKKAGWL